MTPRREFAGRPPFETRAQAEAEKLRRIDALVDRVPKSLSRSKHASPIPVPNYSQAPRHREVMSRPAFDDFIFLLGAKRQGGRIVVPGAAARSFNSLES